MPNGMSVEEMVGEMYADWHRILKQVQDLDGDMYGERGVKPRLQKIEWISGSCTARKFFTWGSLVVMIGVVATLLSVWAKAQDVNEKKVEQEKFLRQIIQEEFARRTPTP